MNSKYTISNILKLIKDPSLVPRAYRFLRKDIVQWCLEIDRRWYSWRYGFPNTDPLKSDWDNFVIIDAARPDILREVVNDPRTVGETKSPASDSRQFIQRCMNGKELHDTVYITANPHVGETLDDGVFHAVINLLIDEWDRQKETVLPEKVRYRTLEVHDRYPNKRLLIHFMQPHFPFIGSHGEDIEAGIGRTLADRTSPHPWYEQMWNRSSDRDKLINAYRENHAIVFDEVEKLLNKLEGKSIVTADHANLIGERGFPFPIRIYGHPVEFPHPTLTTVPRIERSGQRREVTSDTPVEHNPIDLSTVRSRLEDLGYK